MVGVLSKEESHHWIVIWGDIGHRHCPHQPCPTIFILCVDIGAFFQGSFHPFQVTLLANWIRDMVASLPATCLPLGISRTFTSMRRPLITDNTCCSDSLKVIFLWTLHGSVQIFLFLKAKLWNKMLFKNLQFGFVMPQKQKFTVHIKLIEDVIIHSRRKQRKAEQQIWIMGARFHLEEENLACKILIFKSIFLPTVRKHHGG